ncbi:MAG: response regulator transcription factor [Pseudolabrys sp.]
MRIVLIDDDPAVLDSRRLYLERQGVAVTGFADADAFVRALPGLPAFDCVVADVRMRGMSGLDLVRKFAGEGRATPIILITGHGDVDMAVSAIKHGAFDFIEKPFDESRLLEAIRNAGGETLRRQRVDAEHSDLRARFESLSERQRQVLELAVAGLSNKDIAARLSISVRTVEIDRAWMMERMGARNLADLVRMEMQIRKGS